MHEDTIGVGREALVPVGRAVDGEVVRPSVAVADGGYDLPSMPNVAVGSGRSLMVIPLRLTALHLGDARRSGRDRRSEAQLFQHEFSEMGPVVRVFDRTM